MAARRTYYNLKLKDDKIDSITVPLEEVLKALGFIPHLNKTDVEEMAVIIEDNYNCNFPMHPLRSRLFKEDNHIVLGISMSFQPLSKAVTESKIQVELNPLIDSRDTDKLNMRNYRVNLMVRYISESDINKFEEILNGLYIYSYVENED